MLDIHSKDKKNLFAHQSTECKEPHKRAGSQQLYHKEQDDKTEISKNSNLKVKQTSTCP